MPTLTSTRDKVKNRLILSGSGEGGDPTDAIILEAVKDAYTELLGRYALPTLVTATVEPNADETRYIATLAATPRVCHFVGLAQKILIPSVEYSWVSDTIHLAQGLAVTDDELWAWVTPVIDPTASTVTTTCVHGYEWLEPACIWRASMIALERMARPAGSTGAAQHGAMYRSLEVGLEALLKAMKQVEDDWLGTQAAAVNFRLQLGDHPLVESPYATIRERRGGRRANRAVR